MSWRLRSISLFPFLLVGHTNAQQGAASVPVTGGNVLLRQETVIVTGTYQPIPLGDSNRSVQAIDFDSMPELYGSWADGLRLDPSVDLQQRAPGTQADLSILGSSFGQTLVLVDGLRVNDAQSGHHNLDLPIPFASIERIEVLHGSGSTMYGSDAVGGAVNFITAAPKTELVLGVGGGNYGTNEQFGSLGYLHGRLSEQLSFTREFSTGFMQDRDYRNLALASQSRFGTSLGTTSVLLGLSDRPFGADQFYGNFNSWERTKGWFVGASQELGENTQTAFGYRRHTDEFVLLRNQPSVYENNHITESYQMAIRRRDHLAESLTVFYGFEAYRDLIDSNNLGHHDRNRWAFYGDVNFANARRISFSAGARVEAYTGGDRQVSPHISAGYRISDRFKLKGSVGHAFRLPTFTDLYYQDPANLGNPNLKPEQAWSYELGVVWKGNDHLSIEASAFTRRERDGIDYVRSSPDALWQAANIDRLNFTGFEILATVRSGRQRWQLGYTGIHGTAAATEVLFSKYVRNYPAHQATAEWLGSLRQSVQLRTRIGVISRYGQGAYPLAEFGVTKSFDRFSPYLKISNIMNTGYEEIEGVRMPGRLCVAGLKLRLGK